MNNDGVIRGGIYQRNGNFYGQNDFISTYSSGVYYSIRGFNGSTQNHKCMFLIHSSLLASRFFKYKTKKLNT